MNIKLYYIIYVVHDVCVVNHIIYSFKKNFFDRYNSPADIRFILLVVGTTYI